MRVCWGGGWSDGLCLGWQDGMTALHHAAYHGKTEAVALLEAGADNEATDEVSVSSGSCN
eukprot:3278562-Rhodomonas_salina.1